MPAPKVEAVSRSRTSPKTRETMMPILFEKKPLINTKILVNF